jgi:hypothetical protein
MNIYFYRNGLDKQLISRFGSDIESLTEHPDERQK